MMYMFSEGSGKVVVPFYENTATIGRILAEIFIKDVNNGDFVSVAADLIHNGTSTVAADGFHICNIDIVDQRGLPGIMLEATVTDTHFMELTITSAAEIHVNVAFLRF